MIGKIKLEEPFSSTWKFGYIVVNKEPRRNVILYNSNTDRSTISYARYLMSVNIGERIDSNLVVDHINGDQMDDRIENYQLISTEENNIKCITQNNKTLKMVSFECGVCLKEFSKPRNHTHLVIKNKISDYCSRSCAGKSNSIGRVSRIIKEYRK